MRAFSLTRSLLSLACLAMPLVSFAQSESGNDNPAVKQVVDSFMQPYLARYNNPGAIVGISYHGKRYFFSYGTATDGGDPFTPQTLVEIGSCTKAFTVTLFALAINRGQIAPGSPMQSYMPDGYTLRPAAQALTPLQLADFTSSMPDDPTNLPPNLEKRGIENYTVKDFLTWVSHWNPTTVGSYRYSNAGIGLLGFMVTKATHQPWREQLDAEVLGPLGMRDTELRPSPEQKQRLAQGHRANGTNAPVWPIFAWFAAGGLRSTATDMLRFGEANLGHNMVDGQPVPGQLIAAMKLAQQPIYQIPNKNAKQGMVWVTNLGNQPQDRPEILKDGGTAGFSSTIVLNPGKDTAIFIAVNQSGTEPTATGVAIGRHLP
jgi:CubicO group peptidase (beta-lactamase class C family)